jgi:hypothetical protein
MKRHLRTVSMALLVGIATALAAQPAAAIIQFRNEFRDKYVNEDSTDPADVAFAELVKEARCDLCHAGRDKEVRNRYGEALSVLLDHDADKKNVEKIQAALDEVAGQASDPDDPDSPTFGELIEQGKLPGGPLTDD